MYIYSQVKNEELLELRARKSFWNAPDIPYARLKFNISCGLSSCPYSADLYIT